MGLVVTDDEAAADVLSTIMRLLNFQVMRVRKGSEALHAITLGPITLVAFDAGLKDMDGIHFLEVAKKLPNFASARLIASSAVHSEASAVAQKLLKLGVDHFFERPFPVSKLRHKLREMFPTASVTKKKRLSVRDAEALALPGAVILGGQKRPVRLVAGNPERIVIKGQTLPLGNLVRVQLKHKQDVFGELTSLDLVAVGRVLSSTVVGGAPMVEIEVQLSRPPLEWDRMTEALPDL